TGRGAANEISRYRKVVAAGVVDVDRPDSGRHRRATGGLIKTVAGNDPIGAATINPHAKGIPRRRVKIMNVAVGDGVAAVILGGSRGGSERENASGRGKGTVPDFAVVNG